MDNSKVQVILKDNYEKYKSFLDEDAFSLDFDWEDYHQLNNALEYRQKELAKLLILGGARVNKNHVANDRSIRTPLHLAVNLGCPEIVKMLLDKGASINERNIFEETPLTAAAKLRKNHIVDQMLSVLDQENCFNNDHLSHLHVACMRNRVDVVKKLIQKGAEINDAVDKKSLYWPGFTALHFAVEFQCFETAELLLNCGANIIAKDAVGLTPLYRAHMLRDESIIDLILSFHEHELTNPVNPHGLSHFHIACTRNEPLIVEKFIKWGVDINAKVSSGSSRFHYRPINFAIEFGSIDVVKTLLAYKVDLNFTAWDKGPIQMAYNLGKKGIMDLLSYKSGIQKADDSKILKKDTSLEEKLLMLHTTTLNDLHIDHLQCTPLHLAIRNKCSEAIEGLLTLDKNYAITKATCMKNKTPLHLAFESKQEKVVDLILSTYEDFDNNHYDDNGLSHFHIACARNKLEMVERFLQNGVDVNRQVNMDSAFWPGYSALHFAIEFKALNIVNLLLKERASMSLKNGNDFTPLDIAILNMNLWKCNGTADIRQNFDNYDIILRSAASFDYFVDDHGFTLMHAASARNDVSTIRQFLDLHPDVINKPVNWPASDYHGYTPLHLAMNLACFDAANLLVERGGDVTAKNPRGDTPLHTIHHYHEHLFGAYISINTKLYLTEDNPVSYHGYSHFHVACHFDKLDAVKHFLNRGVDVNQPVISTEFSDHVGQTPLHLACTSYNSNVSVVQLLLDHGAEINARDAILNTPLHYSFGSDLSPELIKILLSRGADLSARNDSDMTPLLLLLCDDTSPLEDEELCKIIELLLENGADINDESLKGKIPLTGRKHDMDSFRDSFAVMMKHVKKLDLIGYYITNKNRKAYKHILDTRNEEKWYDEAVHVQRCSEELARMASVNLNGCTTLRDILHKGPNGLAICSKSSTLQKLVESPETLKKDFPIYGYLLKPLFDKGVERMPLLEQAQVALNWLIGLTSEVPVDCLERIMREVNNDDLRNVIHAVSVA